VPRVEQGCGVAADADLAGANYNPINEIAYIALGYGTLAREEDPVTACREV